MELAVLVSAGILLTVLGGRSPMVAATQKERATASPLGLILSRASTIAALVFAAVLAGILLAVQLATTKFGISASKLTPKLTKLNPLTKLRQLPQQNMASFTQAILLA